MVIRANHIVKEVLYKDNVLQTQALENYNGHRCAQNVAPTGMSIMCVVYQTKQFAEGEVTQLVQTQCDVIEI